MDLIARCVLGRLSTCCCIRTLFLVHVTVFFLFSVQVIEFHGNKDTTINISQALAVQAQYKTLGLPYG